MINESSVSSIKSLFFERDQDSHKGHYGRILIGAGSLGMCGAAVLAAKGAYRSGAGVVSVSIPMEFFPIIHCGVPEAVLVDREIPMTKIDEYHSMVLGPGIGQGESAKDFLKWVLDSYKNPLVLDADALNIAAGFEDYSKLKNYQGDIIITPHPGEARRLLHIGLEEYNRMTREQVTGSLAQLIGCVVVLKGHKTLIYKDQGLISMNTTGNPGMATGGTGDVLAGVIAALLGRGFKPYDAARAGVYIHGLAGDIAAKQVGMTSMTAGDLIQALPAAFIEMERGK
ncbi:MAG: NAD(P)H-hydrate dehydratase [Anaerovoracaceae bacterium]|jgi:NAD(P)H-hydrate epimerase|nr:NAD(P)H-hydrate dehydratase [Anaerovoracaceae bacterium]